MDELRKQVTYVFQEHMLLSESIRDNLLLANPEATQAQMLEACRIAGAMDFIEQMPDGIDSIIGRSGDTLSVGRNNARQLLGALCGTHRFWYSMSQRPHLTRKPKMSW